MIPAMKLRFPVAALGTVFLLLTLFSGCHTVKPAASSTATGYPVTVSGVKLSKAPANAVVLSPSLAEILTDMGYGSAVCGRSEECDAPAAIKALPSVGSMLRPDADKLTALKPDCVLTQSALPDTLEAKLKKAGIPVIVVPAAGSFDELAAMYKTVGQVFSGSSAGEEKGEAAMKKLNAALGAVTKRVSALSAKQPVTALYITDAFGHAATGDTVMGRLIQAAGGVNAAQSGTGWTVLAEQLKSATVIFCPKELVDTVKAMAALKDTPAVAQGRIYGIDSAAMERQSLTMADAAEAMARTLYPAAWADESASDVTTGTTTAALS